MTVATKSPRTPATRKPRAPKNHALAFDCHLLQRAIKVVAPAASTNGDRPILQAVHFTSDGDRLRMVATDSYRLYMLDLTGIVHAAPGLDVMIPADWLLRWTRRRYNKGERITLTIANGKVTLDDGDESTTATVIGGQYPGVDSILNASVDDEATAAFNPRFLSDVFRTAQVWAGGAPGFPPIRVVHLNPLKPSRFETTIVDGLLVQLLMPVRVLA